MENCIIKKEALQEEGITLKQAIIIAAIGIGVKIDKIKNRNDIEELREKGYIGKKETTIELLLKGEKFIDELEKERIDKKEEIPKEYKEIRKLWPIGTREDNVEYRCSSIEVKNRVKMLEKEIGRKISGEELLRAGEKYISRHRDERTLKTLKNFIYKTSEKEGGEIEISSELLNYLEDQEEKEKIEERTDEGFFFY